MGHHNGRFIAFQYRKRVVQTAYAPDGDPKEGCLMEFHVYSLFVITTAIIIFSPGPSAILIASNGSSNGFGRAFLSILGFNGAAALYFILSATGIAALLVASHLVFAVIKWVGVLYLVYLGYGALFSKSGGIQIRATAPKRSAVSLMGQGFLVEFSNPKALLYFSAVLPQFLDITRAIAPQIILMGITTFVLQLVIYGAYAFMGDRIARGGIKAWVVGLINKCAGTALWFAAFKMAFVTAQR